MNKKFSTLMAVALMTGSFSMSAIASTAMFAAPAAIETKAAAASNAKEVDDLPAIAVAGQLSAFTNNARLVVFTNDGSGTIGTGANAYLKGTGDAKSEAGAYVSGTPDVYYWTLQTDGRILNKEGQALTLADKQIFAVVPVVDATAATTATPYFVLAVTDGATTKYVVTTDASTFTLDADVKKAALFASVEAEYNVGVAGDDINQILGDGFELTIAKAAGSTVAITGADAFKGVLKAVKVGGTTNDATKYYQLKNGDKFVALKKGTIATDVNAEGEFTLVSATDVVKPEYLSFFHVSKADNGEEGVVVKVSDDADATAGANRLYVSSLKNSNVLSAAKVATVTDSWAYAKLAGENTVDLKTLLKGQFIKISYVANGKENTTDTDNKYKVGGILSVRNIEKADGTYANFADYVAKSSVIAEAPEAQWALTTADGGKTVTLKNRENTNVELTLTQLRATDKVGVYKASITGDADANAPKFANDLITISFVENHTKTDGYMVEADNVLRNTTYYLGQSRLSADGDINAYWAENHGTHQIGATVDKEVATKWNLHLVKKADGVNDAKNITEIDSVLVVSTMNVWNETKKELTTKKDTLVVLPYAFQNRENREFVKLNDEANLKFYICDDKNLDNENASPVITRPAQRFALKMKPNGTYNYVTLAANAYTTSPNIDAVTEVGANKVYQANSTSKGTWANMLAYAGDDNALMVVEKTEDPEYRKIKVEWGDTISIYRQENDAQKLYEKLDAKSVVEKDTLSFLNIDNDYQFKMNPAIFADTAYINRGTGDDANTCYQYLLVVEPSFGYHKEGCNVPGHPQTIGAIDTVYGRFLVNLIDTANIYGKTHLHNNPYINKIEADENLAKLSFVDGYHTGDKLYIPRHNNTDTLVLDMNSPAFNVAKFAFRYVDNEAGTFKIQTQWKEYNPSIEKEKDLARSQEGYLRWVNGTVVVTNGYTNGDVFNMNENVKLNPVANEKEPSLSTISVIATDGGVIISGAQGKKVTISNVLGQTVANTVIASDKAEIAAPAGVVVVAVEGEAAVKAIVK